MYLNIFFTNNPLKKSRPTVSVPSNAGAEWLRVRRAPRLRPGCGAARDRVPRRAGGRGALHLVPVTGCHTC